MAELDNENLYFEKIKLDGKEPAKRITDFFKKEDYPLLWPKNNLLKYVTFLPELYETYTYEDHIPLIYSIEINKENIILREIIDPEAARYIAENINRELNRNPPH